VTDDPNTRCAEMFVPVPKVEPALWRSQPDQRHTLCNPAQAKENKGGMITGKNVKK
jgi:hypothetical protein